MPFYRNIKEAFSQQAAYIHTALENIQPAQWEAPTRLEGWTVYTLAAHLLRMPKTIADFTDDDFAEDMPNKDAVDYWDYSGPEAAEGNTKRTLQIADTTSPETIATDFARAVEAAQKIMHLVPANEVLNTNRGFLQFADYVWTRVLELTVHSLDLADALGKPVELDPEAVKLTVFVLERLLAEPRPMELKDDVEFMEAATGRKKVPGVYIPAFS